MMELIILRCFVVTGNLKKMLKKMVESKNEEEQKKNFEPLEEMITNIQFAYDEGDYGECAVTVNKTTAAGPHAVQAEPYRAYIKC